MHGDHRNDTMKWRFWRKKNTRAQEVPIPWSDSPGCFENHLRLRHKNPLFPAERRNVSRSEIIEARARDWADMREFQTRYQSLLASAVALPDRADFIEIVELWETGVGLLVRSAEVGGIANDAKASIQNLCDAMVTTMREAVLCEQNAAVTLNNLVELWWARSEVSTHELLAQIGRSDTPFLEADVIPALLSGDADTVRLFVEKTKGCWTKQNRLYEESLKLIADTRKEGYCVPEADEKLSALASLAA